MEDRAEDEQYVVGAYMHKSDDILLFHKFSNF